MVGGRAKSGGVDEGGKMYKISIKFKNNIKISFTYNKDLLLILLVDGKAESRAFTRHINMFLYDRIFLTHVQDALF